MELFAKLGIPQWKEWLPKPPRCRHCCPIEIREFHRNFQGFAGKLAGGGYAGDAGAKVPVL